MSKWMYSYLAQSPDGPQRTWPVGLPERDLKLLISKGHTEKLSRARLIEEVFQDPSMLVSIIKGWGRNKAECFIYVTLPSNDYRSDSIQTPAQPGRMFLIFVLPDGTIDDWSWRGRGDGERPDGVLGEIIWPQT
jgi:hypothetical protein